MTATVYDGDHEQQVVYESPQSIDTILSKELLQLSLKDRNAVDEEIHGVSTLAPEETPAMLEAALHDLALELQRIPDRSPIKAAYLESQILPETYVNTKDFRLRFLRVDLFDPQKAAMRMVKFLDFASDLFGPEILQREMRITDFKDEEEKLLRAGMLQIMPYRDKGGRPILAWCGDFGLTTGNSRSRTKYCLYLAYAMSDDLESQRNGIVKLAWVGKNRFGGAFPSWEEKVYQERLYDSFPVRVCVTHFCTPNTPFFRVLRAIYILAQSNKPRIKLHTGEEIEMLYQIKSYGIPTDLIPVTETGNIKLTYHKQWIRARKLVEEQRSRGIYDSSVVVCPGSKDVIFRKGVTLTSHPGNSKFQSILESRIEEHCQASQKRKIEITKEIIELIQRRHGRFFQWDNKGGCWTQVQDPSKIHSKVAVSIKGLRGKSTLRRSYQVFESSTSAFQNQNGKRQKLSSIAGCCNCDCDSSVDTQHDFDQRR